MAIMKNPGFLPGTTALKFLWRHSRMQSLSVIRNQRGEFGSQTSSFFLQSKLCIAATHLSHTSSSANHVALHIRLQLFSLSWKSTSFMVEYCAVPALLSSLCKLSTRLWRIWLHSLRFFSFARLFFPENVDIIKSNAFCNGYTESFMGRFNASKTLLRSPKHLKIYRMLRTLMKQLRSLPGKKCFP